MTTNIKNSLLLFSWILSFSLCAQVDSIDFKRDFRYNIQAASSSITLDGKVDEAAWQACEVGTNFWQKLPYYAPGADPKTEIRLCFDDDFIYVSAICYQEEDPIILSLKRDEYWDSDGIAIVLDPLDSRSNAVLFGLSAMGVQWDAVRTETSDISSDWSNRWFGETHIGEGYWSMEMAIPFRILRYNQSITEWGMNFVRNVINHNEYHNWTAVPESFWPPNPAFSGALVWAEAPERKSRNFNIIPYAIAGLEKEANSEATFVRKAGVDAKIALNSALNLDLTLNPDFSQIEADELVTNLTRFDIGLPEKRTFFLENADLFADFGTGQMRPFFSRKIGLDENFQAVPIYYGARLTGNVTTNTRIGFMNIQSGRTDNALGQNQTAFSARQQFGRSFIQGLFLNRQAFNNGESVQGDFGRNGSIEGLYSTDNGQFSVWGAMHRSFKSGYTDEQMVFNTGTQFTNEKWGFLMDNIFFQKNYFADMGFIARVNNYDAERDTVVRVGYNSSYSSLDYRIRPREGKIVRHQFGVENLTIFNEDWTFNEQYNRLRYFISFRNTAEFRIRLNYNLLDLLFPFSFTGATPLPATRYQSVDLNVEYESDERKPLSYQIDLTRGGFYNGTITRLSGDLNYRVSYWGNFGLGYQWNDLNFPDPYGNAQISALVSKIEIGFSRNVLWTTLFQYVGQSNFMGINSRLQWRYSPMSDIFLVFLDNYTILDESMGNLFNTRNRALILKVNYWW